MPSIILSTAGSQTWNPPADCPPGTALNVEAWGGGSGASGRSGAAFGAGGAGGAYADTPSYFLTPNDYINGVPITIGAGSAGTSGADPIAGGNTTFANNNPLNLISNSINNGAVVGVPGTQPSGGGISNAGGLSTSVIAIGTTNTGYQFLDIRIFGTSAGELPLFAYTTSATASTQTGTFQCAIVGGSLANISSTKISFDAFTSGFATLLSTLGNQTVSLTSTLTPNSITVTAPATTAVGNLYLALQTVTSGAIDITLRMAALQFELGSSATAWKSTPGFTLAQGGGAPSGTTGGVGSSASNVTGPNGFSQSPGSGAAFNTSGSGGGAAGWSGGTGGSGTTAGVGGSGAGTGGAVKTTSPGNPGGADARGGGGGGGLTTVAGTGGAGGAPGGGGGGAAVATGTGGSGAAGQIKITYTQGNFPYISHAQSGPVQAQ